MRRHIRFTSWALLVLSGTLAVPTPFVPTASANDLGAVDFNIAMNLAGLAQRSVSVGAVNCSDGSRTFATTTDMLVGLAMDQRVQTQLSMNCRPSLSINSGVQTISGTMTIPSKGVTDGTFVADCSARGSMAVTASVAVGAAVSGLLSVNVASASAPLAFGCTFKGSSPSKATDVFGTIEGYADVAGMCNSACVAISMTAKATVTAATGELKGQTGSGTYTYSDAFELPELAAIADQLASMKGKKRERDQRVSCPEGATDCTIYDTNPCPNGADSCEFTSKGSGSSGSVSGGCPAGATCTTIPCPAGATCTIVPPPNTNDEVSTSYVTNSRPPSTMSVVLKAGSGEVVIVRPMGTTAGAVSTLAATDPLTVSGPPSAKCTLAFAGKKTVRRALTLSSSGTATLTYTTSQLTALVKQLGYPAKSKTKPTMTASVNCTSTSGTLPTRSRPIQIG